MPVCRFYAQVDLQLTISVAPFTFSFNEQYYTLIARISPLLARTLSVSRRICRLPRLFLLHRRDPRIWSRYSVLITVLA